MEVAVLGMVTFMQPEQAAQVEQLQYTPSKFKHTYIEINELTKADKMNNSIRLFCTNYFVLK